VYVVSHHTLPFVRNGKEMKPGTNLCPNGTLETLDEAIQEAQYRMQVPARAIKSEITIQRTDDGKMLRRWVYVDTTGEWLEAGRFKERSR
jgi:hypothetical protein